MPVDTVKRNKRQDQWKKENRDRVNFVMPKGTKEKIRAAADVAGLSMSEWINAAIDEKLNRG